MNLETSKQIFTDGWNNRFQKPNPYSKKKENKEYQVFDSGECAACQLYAKLENSFNSWRKNNGFPLTNKERAAEILAQLPEEFRSLLSYQAYEQGHSAGQDEIDSILVGLAYDFSEAWRKYTARTGKTLV